MTSDILPQGGETWRIEDDHIIDQSGDAVVVINNLCPDFPDAVKVAIAEQIVAVMNFCQGYSIDTLPPIGLRGVLTERDQLRESNARLLKVNQQLASQIENATAPVVFGDRIYNPFCGHGEVVAVNDSNGLVKWQNDMRVGWYPLDMIAKARIKP